MILAVKYGQDLSDIALLVGGDADALFSVAAALGVSVTAELTPGELVEANTGDLSALQSRVATLLALPRNMPASSDQINGNTTIADLLEVVKQQELLNGKEVLYGQCLVDLAMQYDGDAGLMFSLAASLGLSATDSLTAGSRLEVPVMTLSPPAKKLVKLLNEQKNIPASFMDDDGPPETVKLEGIDYWFVYEYVVR